MRFLLCALLLTISRLQIQADWLTFGHDPQRSGWAQEETAISPANAGQLQLGWAIQLDNAPLALNALTAPVVAQGIETPKGTKNLLFVAGSSNGLFAIDTLDGTVLWTRTFGTHVAAKEESFYLCPNAVNATPVIDKEHKLIYTLSFDGKLSGLDLATGDVKFGPFQLVPAAAKPWSLNLQGGIIYTTTSQACGGDRSGIYSMRIDDPMHTESHELIVRRGFGGGMWSRGGTVIGKNKLLYVATGDGAFDPSVGDYSNSFLAVTPRVLDPLDYFTPLNWKDVSKLDLDLPSGGHLAFTAGNREYIIGGGKESVVYLLDAKSLGGANHQKPTFATPVLANEGRALEEKGMWGAPAAWTDASGQSWVYVTVWGALSSYASAFPMKNGPTPHGAVLAFKIAGTPAGETQLQPAWVSPDFNLPDPPVIANGVLFALATGENPRQDKQLGVLHFKSTEEWKNNLLTTAERSVGTQPAVLYALDAKTGKMLFQSGSSMKSWVHFSGLAVSGGAVYAVDHDSRVYCFRLGQTAEHSTR
ncbi:MAG: PQQ-binding-like beta-propeller repeat protein [Acidobacteriaceae bacterium]|nr:PQQ-binding-like beta-propeller repeat protein [Acidobacteriaceae bacterium]